MESEQLIALIVGGTGGLLGLLGLLIAIFAKLSAGAVSRELEIANQDRAQKESAGWMKDRELEKTLKIRAALLDGMQKFKDDINLALGAKPGKVKKDVCYKAISDSGRILSKLCEEQASKLTRTEQIVVEKVKDVAVEVTFQTRAAFESISDPADLATKDRDILTRQRSELTEAQQVLRDRIMDRLIRHTLMDGSESA